MQGVDKKDNDEHLADRFEDMEDDDYDSEKYDIPTFLRKQAD